jgi:hypothetical protein
VLWPPLDGPFGVSIRLQYDANCLRGHGERPLLRNQMILTAIRRNFISTASVRWRRIAVGFLPDVLRTS